MFVRRTLLVLALAISVVRCADQPTAPRRSSSGPQALRWAPPGTPHFSATRTVSGGDGGAFALTPPISLDSYSVSFWAVRGEPRSVRINYLDAAGDNSRPFLQLTTTDPEYVPGIGELTMGDSVLITVTVDTMNIGVSLEPTGLRFGTPGDLQIWYGGAGGDLNADGVVDSTDAYVEQQLLALWYREAATDPWRPIPATKLLDDKSFISHIPHFSEYEVLFDLTTALSDWVVSW
jgi:hypothetical protein